MDLTDHITRAQAKAVVLSIAPYAPSSIVDAISGYVELLANYAPPTTKDEQLQMCFCITMKFLDECYEGASPRHVFDSIILSMSKDLDQDFPPYAGVTDLATQSELLKELNFRWRLYGNLINHTNSVRKPSISVGYLEEYFTELNSPIVSDSQPQLPTEDDVAEVDEVLICDGDVLRFVPAASSAAQSTSISAVSSTARNTKKAPECTPTNRRIIQSVRTISDIDNSSNGSRVINNIRLRNRSLAYYRSFYAEWKNKSGLHDNQSVHIPAKLLLFSGRRPKWRRLTGYDVTIPWRHKCNN